MKQMISILKVIYFIIVAGNHKSHYTLSLNKRIFLEENKKDIIYVCFSFLIFR